MKRLCLYFLLLMLPAALQAQDRRLVVRGFDVNLSDMRAKSDPVYDKDHKPSALVEIIFSASDSIHFDGNIVGKDHQPGKWVVYMPEGSEWIDLSAEGCEPLHYVFPTDKPLLSAHAYVLDLGVRVLNPMRTLVMPTFSYNKSQYSYGLMLGFGKKNGGYIPGFRPGKPTSEFIQKVLNKNTLFGAIYLGIIAVVPILIAHFSNAAALTGISLGGTSIIIVVGVALETIRALEAQMLMRNYKGFLD